MKNEKRKINIKHEPHCNSKHDDTDDDIWVNKFEHHTDDDDDDDYDVGGKIYKQEKTIKTGPDDCDDREEEKCGRKKGKKLCALYRMQCYIMQLATYKSSISVISLVVDVVATLGNIIACCRCAYIYLNERCHLHV